MLFGVSLIPFWWQKHIMTNVKAAGIYIHVYIILTLILFMFRSSWQGRRTSGSY